VRLQESLSEVRKLTWRKAPERFIPELRAICAGSGVAVVVVRAPEGCRASGASRFLSTDKAVLMLSFRHLTDDHVWYTFFHEVAHLLLHGRDAIYIDADDDASNDMEVEANRFAADWIVPPAERARGSLSLRYPYTRRSSVLSPP
jgi:Zn-dependent peptidase ImmA (M78 family)